MALRRAMVTAVESVPGTDPDRASFTITLEAAKETLTAADGAVTADAGLTGRIGRAVLDDLLPPRDHGSAHARSNPRCPAGTRPTHTYLPPAPR